MDKFGIDEDYDIGFTKINPFAIRPLPKFHMTKGTAVEALSVTPYNGYVFKERKGISGLFFSSKSQEERFFHFEDEYLYCFSKKTEYFEVQEAWHLRRVFNIEIQKENHQKINLVLINKSHNPADEIKVKNIQVINHKEFMEHLRKQLAFCDIDLH